LFPSVYARASKRSHTEGKCVLLWTPFFNIAEVGIGCEIKTTVIHKMLLKEGMQENLDRYSQKI
jgi:hypothetical protein